VFDANQGRRARVAYSVGIKNSIAIAATHITTAPANTAVQGDNLQFVCCLDKGLNFSEYFKFSFSISIAVIPSLDDHDR
jgi:hypothetical protein